MGFSTGPLTASGSYDPCRPALRSRATAKLLPPIMRGFVALPRRALRPAGER